MSITFNIRHLDCDWFSSNLPSGNTFSLPLSNWVWYSNTVAINQPTLYYQPFTYVSRNILPPSYVASDITQFNLNTSLYYQGYDILNYPCVLMPDPTQGLTFGYPTFGDNKWSDVGWDTSSDSNFTNQLCIFFANNMPKGYPGVNSYNLAIFRGMVPGTSYPPIFLQSIPICWVGNDPNYDQQIII